ncbi:MAG TPA: YciI family protein, partial [Tepidiformaceae bacterium]|nr:YciI family protein [Tepidiformaceae bacterium]
HELQPVSTATTVRVRDGKVAMTDGPFAETRETLGGFYLIACNDLDQALSLAGKVPSAKVGSIEVRPVAE